MSSRLPRRRTMPGRLQHVCKARPVCQPPAPRRLLHQSCLHACRVLAQPSTHTSSRRRQPSASPGRTGAEAVAHGDAACFDLPTKRLPTSWVTKAAWHVLQAVCPPGDVRRGGRGSGAAAGANNLSAAKEEGEADPAKTGGSCSRGRAGCGGAAAAWQAEKARLGGGRRWAPKPECVSLLTAVDIQS